MSRLARFILLSLVAPIAAFLFAFSSFVPEAHAKCVRGVASNDVLNIRNGPGTGYRVVGGIPPGTCGVVVLRREGNWSYVDYGRGGFVSSRFLESDGDDSIGRGDDGYYACVSGIRFNDVLNMRTRPTTGSRIVTGIPPNACGVLVRYRQGGWLRVVYGGREGWAYGKYLRR